MPTITISKHFECSPDIAFDVISDFPNAPEYIGGIKDVQMISDGPVAVGTKLKETRIMMGREASEIMEVTVMDKPSTFVVEAFNHGTEYVTKYTVEPEGEGSKVTLVFSGTPKTFMAKVMAALFSRMISTVADLMEKEMIDAAEEGKRRATAN